MISSLVPLKQADCNPGVRMSSSGLWDEQPWDYPVIRDLYSKLLPRSPPNYCKSTGAAPPLRMLYMADCGNRGPQPKRQYTIIQAPKQSLLCLRNKAKNWHHFRAAAVAVLQLFSILQLGFLLQDLGSFSPSTGAFPKSR